MAAIIDSDQHLYEARTMWAGPHRPGLRDEALTIVDDDLGYPWLTWRGRPLDVADVQVPGDTATLGRQRQRRRHHCRRNTITTTPCRRTTGSHRPVPAT